ncbi:MAG TPA: 4a-hydroxytetrahydrobiopterin dehydratase [Candidatus Thermoplasmatota archaeon]|nr:4a-hydroxytetrahydrobiopterin dehydratase [Candidatus Thermoplasmatota archaeon]
MTKYPPGWHVDEHGKRVSIAVKARDFLDALDLFQEIGDVAEELEHHPDLHLEGWNRVRIESYSHDVGHLTERDEGLVAKVHDILLSRGMVKAP